MISKVDNFGFFSKACIHLLAEDIAVTFLLIIVMFTKMDTFWSVQRLTAIWLLINCMLTDIVLKKALLHLMEIINVDTHTPTRMAVSISLLWLISSNISMPFSPISRWYKALTLKWIDPHPFPFADSVAFRQCNACQKVSAWFVNDSISHVLLTLIFVSWSCLKCWYFPASNVFSYK